MAFTKFKSLTERLLSGLGRSKTFFPFYDSQNDADYRVSLDTLITFISNELGVSGKAVFELTGVTNTGNNYISTLDISGYKTEGLYIFKPSADSDNTSSLNVNSVGILDIKEFDGTDLVDKIDLKAVNTYLLLNKTSYWLVVGGVSGSGAMFPLEDIVVSLGSGENLGPWTDGETIPLSTATTLQEAFEMLAISTQNPTLTNPFISSLVLSGTGYNSTVEVGLNIPNLVATTTFNRGLISPDYTISTTPPYTNSPRSGVANNYAFSGKITGSGVSNASTPQSVNTSNGNNTVSVLVDYDAGGQPKNSALGDFSAPLAAGSVSLSTTYQGKYKIFYGARSSNPVSGTSDARGLSNVFTGAQTISLNPGLTEIDFYVYLPVSSSLSITNAIVSTTLENITSLYILVTSGFQIPDAGGNLVSYKEYKMTNAIPYTDSALRHTITIG